MRQAVENMVEVVTRADGVHVVDERLAPVAVEPICERRIPDVRNRHGPPENGRLDATATLDDSPRALDREDERDEDEARDSAGRDVER